MLSARIQNGFRAPGQQRFEVLEARGAGKLRIQMRQVGVRLHAVGFGGLDQRVQVRAGACAGFGVAEQPVLAADDEGADRVLAAIVVCALSKVHEFCGCEPRPATLAPAGSTWSGPGGDKWSEALQETPS